MTNATYIARYPAYDIVEPEVRYHGTPIVYAGEPLAIYQNNSMNGNYKQAYASSVVSYALRSNADPIAWVEQSKAKGEDLHWINLSTISLTAERQERKTLKALYVGQAIFFEGQYFFISPAPNGNFKLVAVESE